MRGIINHPCVIAAQRFRITNVVFDFFILRHGKSKGGRRFVWINSCIMWDFYSSICNECSVLWNTRSISTWKSHLTTRCTLFVHIVLWNPPHIIISVTHLFSTQWPRKTGLVGASMRDVQLHCYWAGLYRFPLVLGMGQITKSSRKGWAKNENGNRYIEERRLCE